MYTPAAFRKDDPAEISAFLDAHPFATLVTAGAEGLSATPMPLLRVEGGAQGVLIGHMAKANPHWREVGTATPALAIFSGAHGYVSPSWYPTKAETGKVVPTWNYIAVHVHGRLDLVEDEEGKLEIVTQLTDRHEGRRKDPWAVSDAPADYVAAQLRAIVGVRLTVERIVGKWKLSQNRRADDVAGVRAGLAASDNMTERELAAAMAQAAG